MKGLREWINRRRQNGAKKYGRKNGVLKWADWEALGYRHERNAKAEDSRSACRAVEKFPPPESA